MIPVNSTVLVRRMARSDPQINLRIPADLKERIEAAAKVNKRSMNAEIAERLEASFQYDEQVVLPTSPEALQEAMAFALGKVMERPDWPDKLAAATAARERPKKEGDD